MPKVLDWDSPIGNDSEFTILEPGDYDFEVTNLEKSRTKNGYPMAVLTLKVSDDNASTSIKENLVLIDTCEWKISQFLRSIGQKEHGETVYPDWSNMVGTKGRCKVIKSTFTGKDGQERETNNVDRFYDAKSAVKKETKEEGASPKWKH